MTDSRAIYRGPGGSGDAVADTSNQSVSAIAAAAAAEASKLAAAASATAAASSASSASTSATTATNQATSAASSASSASTSATNAASSATSASTSASTSQTAANDSAASAALAQDWATKTSGPVAGGEYSAKYHATAAASSTTTASSSATTATTQASLAASSATSAASSASTATTKASEASTSASNAATSASAASSSASSASSSASSASSSASTASTKASEASTSASNAATSASSASTSASNASTSATNAASSASSANSSATAASAAQSAAETARDQTLTAYDNFDDRYLGSKTSDPSLDNDGNALVGGALYFNSVDGAMKVYTGSTWVAAYASGADFLAKASNLSDLPNVSTARTNLGLGSAAITASTDYATASQGTKADTAYGWGNHASAGYLGSGAIGVSIQAYDSDLTTLSGLTPTNNYVIVGNGSSWTSAPLPASGVSSVSGTSPISSSGGSTPSISISQASGSTDGYLSSIDWSTFNSKGNGTVTSVSGTGTVNGISLTGTVSSSGSLTLGGTLSNVSLSSQVTGTLPIANGGTGATTAGGALTNIVGFTPVQQGGGGSQGTNKLYMGWGGSTLRLQVDSTDFGANWPINASNVTGTVAVANGGTGATTFTANNVLLGNGTNAFQVVAPSTSGNVLISNGTTWTSGAAPAAGLGIGQTWTNVASSRAFGTTYTNSTGKPIFVSVSLATSQSGTISAVVGGVTIASHYFQYEPATPFVDFVVPNGSTYSVSGNKGLGMWFELR